MANNLEFPVPFYLGGEKRLFNGLYTARQAVYGFVGAFGGIGVGFVSIVFFSAVGLRPLGYILGIPGGLLLAAAGLVLAFVPAGRYGLPGPRRVDDRNPYSPPLRIDQWVGILLARKKKSKAMVWQRREGAAR